MIVLSEDTGKDGAKTIQVVLRKLLQPFAHSAPLYNERSDRHERVDASKDGTLATGAKDWKSSTTRDVKIDIRRRALFTARRRALFTALTTELLSHIAHDGPGTFVFLHFDGDAAWSTHPKCIDCARFEAFVSELQRHVTARAAKRHPDADLDDVVRRAMSRLIPVQPHWSIEAWLYGESDCAAELCQTRHQGEHEKSDAHWRVPRAELEECAFPKRACCLSDEHNLALAKRFRAESAMETSPSFGALAANVRACSNLLAALNAL